jgi:hypothetical protein
MLLKTSIVAAAVACLLMAPTPRGADEVQPELKGVKCLMMPAKEVKEAFSAEHMEAKVFFCCNGCKGKFESDSDKHATAANMQLVQTKLFKQSACPLSGGELNPDTEIEFKDVKIQFCCNNCKGAVEGKDDDKEKAEMMFSKEAFKKGFVKVKPKQD